MDLDKNTILLFQWIDYVGHPAFGGHIERGEPLTDQDVKSWLEAGFIKLADPPVGYVLTDKGRRAAGV